MFHNLYIRWIRLRRAILSTAHVAWACRVSVLGVFLPGLALIYLSQGRDLFSYFSGATEGGANLLRGEFLTVCYWGVMAGITWAFWTYPLHASARIILYDPYWLFPKGRSPSNAELRRTRLLYRPLIVWIPRILATAPFLILAVASYGALRDLPGRAVGDLDTKNASSIEVSGMLWLMQLYFVGCAIAAFVRLARFRARSLGRSALRPLAQRTAPLVERYRVALGDQMQMEQDVAEARIWLALVSAGLILTLVAPSFVTNWVFLAFVVPIVAGAWVPLLTWLAMRSHRRGVPLIAALLVILAILTRFFGDNYDITLSDSNVRPRLIFSEAVDRWMIANGCNKANIRACPRPIIVSTAGGASRAGFFTVTVLGDLLDNPSFDQTIPGVIDANGKARHVINRIFAISGVSGGSVGTAIFAGAIANSANGEQPCVPGKRSDFWFRDGSPTSWRGCLQAIMAEDFLSETIVGLSFRDNLNFLNRFFPWPDRAAVLEKSWIVAFEKWIKKAPDDKNFFGLDQPFTQYRPEEGKWRPLLVLNGTSVTTGRRIITTNVAPFWPASAQGAAVDAKAPARNERLFMDAYDLYEVFAGHKACENAKCEFVDDSLKDIQLATAATNSARFPIISPPGTLRGQSGAGKGIVVDRIVDGGYFENDGITTTIDLVRALLQVGLRPAVIHIANDPLPYIREDKSRSDAGSLDQVGWRFNGPTIPVTEDRSWLLFLRGPIGGLLATRGARASYALRDLEDNLKNSSSFAEVLVYGEPTLGFPVDVAAPKYEHGCHDVPPAQAGTPLKPVSMSWWLSQPVQEYLDAQLALARNCFALDRVRTWLKESEAPKDAPTALSSDSAVPDAAKRADPPVSPAVEGNPHSIKSRSRK